MDKPTVSNVPPPPDKKCALCVEADAELRVVVSDLEGTVLDITEVCRPCFRRHSGNLGLEPGEKR